MHVDYVKFRRMIHLLQTCVNGALQFIRLTSVNGCYSNNSFNRRKNPFIGSFQLFKINLKKESKFDWAILPLLNNWNATDQITKDQQRDHEQKAKPVLGQYAEVIGYHRHIKNVVLALHHLRGTVLRAHGGRVIAVCGGFGRLNV